LIENVAKSIYYSFFEQVLFWLQGRLRWKRIIIKYVYFASIIVLMNCVVNITILLGIYRRI